MHDELYVHKRLGSNCFSKTIITLSSCCWICKKEPNQIQGEINMLSSLGVRADTGRGLEALVDNWQVRKCFQCIRIKNRCSTPLLKVHFSDGVLLLKTCHRLTKQRVCVCVRDSKRYKIKLVVLSSYLRD